MYINIPIKQIQLLATSSKVTVLLNLLNEITSLKDGTVNMSFLAAHLKYIIIYYTVTYSYKEDQLFSSLCKYQLLGINKLKSATFTSLM